MHNTAKENFVGSYIVSPIDDHIAVSSDIDGAKCAYADTRINTVLMPSPLANAFDYALRVLDADQVDACKEYLNLLHPEEYAGFKNLNTAQQSLIMDIKAKEERLAYVFNTVIGAGSFIDSQRYVPTRRGVVRTAIPHRDECDTHMVATILGHEGTVLYLKDYSNVTEQDFKAGRVSIDPCDKVEIDPRYLCLIKGTDHPDVYNNPNLGSRWHSSPVAKYPLNPRLASFYAMRNGLHG